MRMGTLVLGLAAGAALTAAACFEGPDWPQSVPVGDVIHVSGSSAEPDGGQPSGGDSGGGGEGGVGNYACNQSSAGTCIQYTDVPSDTLSALETACTGGNGSEVSSCSTTSLVGCCSLNVGYTEETCYYATMGYTTAMESASCAGLGGTFTSTP
jgi:hypothetical protein